jgi:hypothetical protein
MSDSALSALRRLDAVLEGTDVDAELLLVGGAVLSVVFAHHPGTRRPSRLFGDPLELAAAAAAVAEEEGLPHDWLSTAVRDALHDRPSSFAWQGERLGVFTAPPQYALALTCGRLAFGEAAAAGPVEADLRYLLRLLEVSGPDELMGEVAPYLTAGQLGEGFEGRIAALFP